MDAKVAALSISLLLLPLSGCLADTPPGAEDPEAGEDGASGEWTMVAKAEPWFTRAEAVPYRHTVVAGGCDSYEAEVPDGTNVLQIQLTSPEGNTTGHGEQTATFMARPSEGGWRGFYAAGAEEANTAKPPRDNWTMTIQDPDPGTWDIWVWPHGAVVDLTLDLTVLAHGTGPVPPDGVALEGCES